MLGCLLPMAAGARGFPGGGDTAFAFAVVCELLFFATAAVVLGRVIYAARSRHSTACRCWCQVWCGRCTLSALGMARQRLRNADALPLYRAAVHGCDCTTGLRGALFHSSQCGR
ncbi:hypothetical protein J4714_14185 [Staphylococcus epidermidis]|nr:hypothetical protein [Staphylococcus epidermidis]